MIDARLKDKQTRAYQNQLTSIIKEQIKTDIKLGDDDDDKLITELYALYIQEYKLIQTWRNWNRKNQWLLMSSLPSMPKVIKDVGAGEFLNLKTGKLS